MLEEYPDILEVRDISKILRIGKKKVYELLQTDEIINKRIGRSYKVCKKEVINYLNKD